MYFAWRDVERDVCQRGDALEMLRDTEHRQGRLPGARLLQLNVGDNGCVGHACPPITSVACDGRLPPHASRGIATSPTSPAPAETAPPTGRCRPAASAGTRPGAASR